MKSFWVRTTLFMSGLVASPAAFAQSFPLDGTIDPADPQMPVINIVTPSCAFQAVSLVHYDAYPIYVTRSGNYAFTVNSEGGRVSLYLHSDPFDPMAGFASCIAASNTGNPLRGFLAPLTVGVQYYLVPFNDRLDQSQVIPYRLQSIGAGEALFGIAPPTVFANGFEALLPFVTRSKPDFAERQLSEG